MRKPSTYRAEHTSSTTPLEVAISGARALFNTANIPLDRIEQCFAVLRGESVAVSQSQAERLNEPIRLEPCVTRPELAKLLKCGVRNVDYHRRAGHLTPVYIAGTKRARGYTAESVRALLRGDYANDNAETMQGVR